MSTMPGKMLIATDTQLRLTSNTTVNGSAQNKKTCTDALVTVVAGPDGGTAIGGTTTLSIQGSNTSNFASTTAITPDKGSLASITASGTQSVHLAQLQFQYYRLVIQNTAASTVNVTVVWNFHPTEDSFDASQQ